MDQQKIGAFLKVLRKQKGLTQEQIAEKFNVLQIAAYYGQFCGAKRPQCGAERPGFLLI